MGIHGFTGSDTIGRIAGKGKQRCRKLFRNANKDILSAFAQLGQTLVPSSEVVSRSRRVPLLTFRTKGQDQGYGTTALAFIQKEQGGEASSNKSSAERAHRKSPQAIIWLLADTPNPNLPSPTS